jgi:hypothetical protein
VALTLKKESCGIFKRFIFSSPFDMSHYEGTVVSQKYSPLDFEIGEKKG